MKILAIESSCDETAAAIIENGTKILSNVVVSQVDIFAAYGGVIPEVAARSHLEAILPVIHQALLTAGITKYSQNFLSQNPNLQHKIPKDTIPEVDIDAIAVTHTPGLIGSLMIGTLTARMLAILWNKPLYAVHHLKSHIYANWLQAQTLKNRNILENNGTINNDILRKINKKARENSQQANCFSEGIRSYDEDERASPVTTGASDVPRRKDTLLAPEFPLLALIISGGHTQIIYMPSHNHFEIIGTTRDDAIGECYDKVAKILGLPYPGGPAIDQCAKKGNPNVYHLPHPKVPNLDFSFSGLKTAVLRAVQSACNLSITTPSYELQKHLSDAQKANFAASFNATACGILLNKLENALQAHPDTRSLVFAGGVSANQLLRQKAQKSFQNASQSIFFPQPQFTGDNAAMVGAAAYFEIQAGVKPTDPYELNISPRTTLE